MAYQRVLSVTSPGMLWSTPRVMLVLCPRGWRSFSKGAAPRLTQAGCLGLVPLSLCHDPTHGTQEHSGSLSIKPHALWPQPCILATLFTSRDNRETLGNAILPASIFLLLWQLDTTRI